MFLRNGRIIHTIEYEFDFDKTSLAWRNNKIYIGPVQFKYIIKCNI